MGRGVMTVTNAISIVYIECRCSNEDDWLDFRDEIRQRIMDKFPSFQDVGCWDGREEYRILENVHARIVLCVYHGLASINLAVRKDGDRYILSRPFAEHWCKQIAPKFEALFPDRLRRIATASNGELFYEKVNK